ncbi:predicted protein [Uncinocarpus reesii 1704]|uniref:Uncharacterized protein n=1 Tax=Uncinocarpus reesii (strain UAMH 1704) TaxID=336963 RepID=C4JPB1_UNCRE|nr:uncharacterized protein UREG_04493 [Uncinocarpus reesii 1704]EEP79647.1 predicted protein [Uncinocarpus reesii 1704]
MGIKNYAQDVRTARNKETVKEFHGLSPSREAFDDADPQKNKGTQQKTAES